MSPRNSYSTLELMDDLRSELGKYPEALVRVFPERIDKFNNRKLSIFWGMNQYYVAGLEKKFRSNPDFRIPENTIVKLTEKIINKFSVNREQGERKVAPLISLIDSYTNSEIDLLEFIARIKREFGIISPDIAVTYEELSNLLCGKAVSLQNLRDRIQKPDENGNSNYRFSMEQLDSFERAITLILGSDAQKSLRLINLYKQSNPNLLRYQRQQYTVENPDYFNKLDSEEKSYWFGLLCADGWHYQKTYMTGLGLSSRDRGRIETFAKVIGLEPSRIEDRVIFVKKDDIILPHKMSYLRFQAKPISNDLISNGFFDFKHGGVVPHIITELVEAAYDRSNRLSETIKGRIALAFLLGFYDGDGSKTSKNSGLIYNSKREFLLQMKLLFGVDNDVRLTTREVIDEKTGEMTLRHLYSLALGPELLQDLMNVYKDSMPRKRTDLSAN